ncbi:MarR family winged helix-turn-helix transcriptional regulator [Cognatishimia sp. F0-27]|uniref:MarR family winged helix-turn-helix transcriptional regulator n=1 Tax=Cognatishimia sp. F0-27 TaxID=2816855 RepID=UPI001D0CAD82|nr:MarR family transcriptional regulator [Cognatishimia sp. F0-27]
MTEDDGPEYRLEDQIGYKLRLANQRHVELFSRLMPEATPTQFAVLARLREVGPISQNHLGRLVGMDAATTKGVVDRLKSKGFVSSSRSETDLRRLQIALTEEGRRFADAAVSRAREISRATAANLTPRELERLNELLDKL